MSKRRLIFIISFIVIFALIILMSFLVSKNKFTVLFETGTDDFILNQYIEKNGFVQKPIDPIKDGYVFKEWQFNGKTYDFSNEVKQDIVLTAKWVKEEYIEISFSTNSDYRIDNLRVLKGETVTELPESKKDNYEFIGWYLNGIKFEKKEIYSDTLLTAEYRNETINTTYKIGDIVKIVGNYSNKANSNDAYNKKAIGWDRRILDIIDGANYPYVIGDDTGVTGFFKAKSIEK